MGKYLNQFNKVIKELSEHPKVSILSTNTFEPSTLSLIKTLEKKVGHKFDNDLTSFFLETNGIRLLWEFDLNQNLNKTQKQPEDFQPLNFNFSENVGCIFIPSIEELSTSSNLVLDTFGEYGEVVLKSNSEGYLSLSLDNYLESIQVKFSDYFNFLIESKGYIKSRKLFFQVNQGFQNHTCNLTEVAIYHFFKKSERSGSSTANLKTQVMQQHAANSQTVSQAQLEATIEAHHQFLSNGGAGGRWKVLNINGFVFGVYTGQDSKSGKQANFEQYNLSSKVLDTCELQLPFTNFCGAYGKYQDFSDADLSYSLFTDTNFEQAIFADANLSFSDFSRSNLRETSFMNANLENCDFENCDLTGVDFRGANWQGAKFPGAILKDILY